MKNTPTKLGAFMAGVGGAFALFPTGQLDQFTVRDSIEARMLKNFQAAGDHIRTAQGKFASEQEARPTSTR